MLRVLLVLVLLRVAAAEDVDELDLEREVGLGGNAASEAALACMLAHDVPACTLAYRLAPWLRNPHCPLSQTEAPHAGH